MAEADFTAAPNQDRPIRRDLQTLDILSMMKSHVDRAMEQAERVTAVAYGGSFNAGSMDEHGDPTDITSLHLFNIIREMTGDVGDLLNLGDAIAELTAREMIAQAKPKTKGGAA